MNTILLLYFKLQIAAVFFLFTQMQIINELLLSVFTLQNVPWSVAAGEMINLAWVEFTLRRDNLVRLISEHPSTPSFQHFN